MNQTLETFGYIAASVLFIFGLKMLGKAETARRGNLVSAVGMLLAVVVTVVFDGAGLDFKWILLGVVIGSVIGVIAAVRVEMTGMPELVAVFNGFGGAASLLVGWADYHAKAMQAAGAKENLAAVTDGAKALATKVGADATAVTDAATAAGASLAEQFGLSVFTSVAIYAAVIIGGLTLTGSLIAWAKLSGKMDGKPILFGGQNLFNSLVLIATVVLGYLFATAPLDNYTIFLVAVGISLLLGVLVTIPIGGADMPVVISLLNSYSGLAACAAGFVINNNVLIVAGALVGASGIILTIIMCKAMNRSISNVLFSGFGSASSATSGSAEIQGEAKIMSTADAYYILEAASSVVIVPGYGMAVAQAQHVVRELGDLLEENGAEVKFCVHPVAGRMPGHMNVLLAEANVPYEQLAEMDDVNPTMEAVDVAIVIGANDVVNPAARDDESSSIYGMPIVNVDYARTVFVLKRSLAAGFAGVQNPLFFKDNTRMILGDAKATISALVTEFKSD